MFEIDFFSIVLGYIIGVVLCYNTAPLFFTEKNDEDK